MANKIKVRCTGKEKHVNEVDPDKLLQGTTITRYAGKLPASRELQERYVLRCAECTHEVVVTREMIEDFWSRQGE